jgi:phage-related protein
VKAAIFHPAAIAAIRLFPEGVRKDLGKAIFDLQRGEILSMPLSRPMPSVGPGVEELRIRDRSGIYRAFYYAKLARGLLILHAFVKKSSATARRDLDLGKRRYQEWLHEET